MLSEFLTWGSWSEIGADKLSICLYDVEIHKEIGPMMKGERYSSINVFFDTGLTNIDKDKESKSEWININKLKPYCFVILRNKTFNDSECVLTGFKYFDTDRCECLKIIKISDFGNCVKKYTYKIKKDNSWEWMEFPE